MKIVFQFTLFLFLLQYADGQFYNTGQAPASVKWMQIKTDNFQIIYPLGFFKEANRAANILEYMYDYIGADLDRKPKKISILLYNQSTQSNGFVVWAPKRAEWVATPPLDTYAQDWLEQLALHEFRHVVQIDKLEQGFTKVMKVVFGEMAVGAMAGFLPFWFLEGDATVSETSFSSTGRGRQSNFSMELRAYELESEKRFTYDQSYLGSYRHFIPDYYKYGYQMVSYGKLKYGSELWNRTLNNVARRPFTFAPFFFGLRKNGASSKVDLYTETFDSLKVLWSNSLNNDNNSNTSNFYTPEAKHFTNYIFPQQTANGLFAVKTSLDDITRFVLIKDSTEAIIHTPGRYYNKPVSVSNNYFVWEETIPDKRWQKRTYSVVKLFDRKKEKEIILTHKTRYFYPVLSPDDLEIACIEINENNRFSIIILSSQSGEVVRKILFEEGENIQSLTWLNNEELVFISLKKNSKCLKKLTMRSGRTEILYNSGYVDITHAVAANDFILFTRDTEIARNVYAYSLKEKEISRVSNAKYGAEYPSFNRATGDVVYSEYTASGYRPVFQNLDKADKIKLAEIETYKQPWADNLSKTVPVNIQKTNYQQVQFDSSRYRRFFHATNIHSWAPFYFDMDDFTSFDPAIYPGVTVLSQNKLSTVTSSVSYYYTNATHYFQPKIIFEGLFPVFEVDFLAASNPAAINSDSDIQVPSDIKNYYRFNIRSYLPLNFSRNKYSRFIKPSIDYSHWNSYYLSDSAYHLGFDYLEFGVSGSHLLKKSHRDLYSRFGQSLYLSVNQSLKDPDVFSSKTVAILNLYFPGIISNHSTRFYLAHEKNENKLFVLQPRVSLPRGYTKSSGRYIEIIRGTVEYTFPFLYPDWSLGPVSYIKRFHASLFCDLATTKKSLTTDDTLTENDFLVSIGATLAAEMNFFRFFIPFTPKLTLSYLPEKSIFDLGFNISINASVF